MKKLNWIQRFILWCMSPHTEVENRDCTCDHKLKKCTAPITYTFLGLGRWRAEVNSNDLWRCGKVQKQVNAVRDIARRKSQE